VLKPGVAAEIPMLNGRDFLWSDTYPGSAIVNEMGIRRATFIVRTKARSDFRVSNIRTQAEINSAQTLVSVCAALPAVIPAVRIDPVVMLRIE
jgi:hypothetical protein